MSFNHTPAAERTHIALFGCKNAGKSSLLNRITGQPIAVVSPIGGTTTDPVFKAMELLPLGPVMLIDTAGFDDSGSLGELRVEKTRKILERTDIALLVVDASKGFSDYDKELVALFEKQKVPYLTVFNKSELLQSIPQTGKSEIYVSAETGAGIEQLKERLSRLKAPEALTHSLTGDLIRAGEIAVLVTPIDSAAPKGRLILPQQQVLRDILDNGGIAIVTKETELSQTLSSLKNPPAVVITDSQVFEQVNRDTPPEIPLTSFSILMARHKGFLSGAVKAVAAIKQLKNGDRVLISEGCTHHRQCGDIGSVKLPMMLRKHTGKQLDISLTSGGDFPEDISEFALILHCGGCMLTPKEMARRTEIAENAAVPMTNYGIAISYMKGILQRAVAPLSDITL